MCNLGCILCTVSTADDMPLCLSKSYSYCDQRKNNPILWEYPFFMLKIFPCQKILNDLRISNIKLSLAKDYRRHERKFSLQSPFFFFFNFVNFLQVENVLIQDRFLTVHFRDDTKKKPGFYSGSKSGLTFLVIWDNPANIYMF